MYCAVRHQESHSYACFIYWDRLEVSLDSWRKLWSTALVRMLVGTIWLFLLIRRNVLGRLRPDFLATCKWEEIAEACTGYCSIILISSLLKIWWIYRARQNVLDGRKSFPSGHSSTAFSGMMFLSLWIAGQTAAWCFSVPKTPRNYCSSRIMIFLVTLLPLFWASHVALTRLQDNVSFMHLLSSYNH